jgi:hypothetical protein
MEEEELCRFMYRQSQAKKNIVEKGAWRLKGLRKNNEHGICLMYTEGQLSSRTDAITVIILMTSFGAERD